MMLPELRCHPLGLPPCPFCERHPRSYDCWVAGYARWISLGVSPESFIAAQYTDPTFNHSLLYLETAIRYQCPEWLPRLQQLMLLR